MLTDLDSADCSVGWGFPSPPRPTPTPTPRYPHCGGLGSATKLAPNCGACSTATCPCPGPLDRRQLQRQQGAGKVCAVGWTSVGEVGCEGEIIPTPAKPGQARPGVGGWPPAATAAPWECGCRMSASLTSLAVLVDHHRCPPYLNAATPRPVLREPCLVVAPRWRGARVGLCSTAILRLPMVHLGSVMHKVAAGNQAGCPAVWRRCGCLGTRERPAQHGVGGVVSPVCCRLSSNGPSPSSGPPQSRTCRPRRPGGTLPPPWLAAIPSTFWKRRG